MKLPDAISTESFALSRRNIYNPFATYICVTIVGDAQECNYLLRLKQQHLVRIREQRHKLLDEIPRVYYKHQVSKISSA